MKLVFIGTGYVGLVSASCFADVGNQVYCVDKNLEKIDGLKGGKIPFYEPGLGEIIRCNMEQGRMFFTSDLSVALDNAEVCFVTVDTPPSEEGNVDITNVIAVAESIGDILDQPLVVVTKSTVPVGVTLRVKEVIQFKLRNRGKNPEIIKVASNPEFLKEGDSINDFRKPDRIIVGVEEGQDNVADILHQLYSPFMRKRDRFIKMDIASAELTKYAANSMLAVRISFMNSLARLCDKVGGNIELVRCGMSADPRIGPDFLFAGLGYGGPCLTKDVKALKYIAREYGETLPLVEAADVVNETQLKWFFEKVKKHFSDNCNLSNKTVAIWGLSFKANTDDIRGSKALELIKWLINEGANVKVYDPKAMGNVRDIFGEKITYCSDMYKCVGNADALIVCTDWNEFKSPYWEKLGSSMKNKVIFDGKNLFSSVRHMIGGLYYAVGL